MGRLPRTALTALRELSRQYRLSVVLGDMLYLDERWYVSHAGLLRIAQRRKCSGINVECLGEFSDPAATTMGIQSHGIYLADGCKGFVGYGDADPSNVSALVRQAEWRISENAGVGCAAQRPTASAFAPCAGDKVIYNPFHPAKIKKNSRASR